MTSMFRPAAGLAALAFATAAAAQGAAAETLTVAQFAAPAHVITSSVLEPLAAKAAEASNGALEIKVYHGGELGPGPVEQYARAVTGVADITWGLPGYTSAQFPLSLIVELPGIVDAAGSGYDAWWRAWATGALADEFPGTVPLAMWTSEPNVIIMRDKQVRTPADLAGLKIRVSGAVAGEVVTALGGTPVQMPANEMYNALQTGLIDGIITGASAINDFKLFEVANSYTTGASLGNILFFLVMNKERYEGLAPELRAALDQASGYELSKSGEEGWNARADEMLARLRADPSKTVIDLTPEEAAAFNAITVGVTDKVVAELDARGLPASAVRAAMIGQ